jgi:Hexokinase
VFASPSPLRDALNGCSNTSTINVLDKFNYRFNIDYDEDDVKVIQYATALVSYRAALLVSICTSVLLNRMTEEEITIAVDGSVYKHHPRLKKWMEQLISELSPEKNVNKLEEKLNILKLSSAHIHDECDDNDGLTLLLIALLSRFSFFLVRAVPIDVGRRRIRQGCGSRECNRAAH